MKIRFVYHKGKDSLIGKVIVAYTWLLAVVRLDFKSLKYNFGHVEYWEPDENGEFSKPSARTYINAEPPDYLGQCFSSTTRGDAQGVRFAPASEVLRHPERWMYQEYEVAAFRVEAVMPLLQTKVGLKYDFLGVSVGFSTPFNIQDEKKWYCSEICSWFAWFVGLLHKQHKRISPRRLAKVLGGELKELKA